MGSFSVDSGRALLRLAHDQSLSVSNSAIPYNGTLVIAEINFSNPGLLEEALRFGGKKHSPVDFVETNYEGEFDDDVVFVLKDESTSFGSRPAGTPVRTKLMNLYHMANNNRIVVDLSDISLILSSFADEVFGKLFVEVGPMAFMRKFEFKNVMTTTRQLIDRAIEQRVSVASFSSRADPTTSG
ncbi:MAG: STAS-like domain-containing protein [Gammaproteobacteria bacterium]